MFFLKRNIQGCVCYFKNASKYDSPSCTQTAIILQKIPFENMIAGAWFD